MASALSATAAAPGCTSAAVVVSSARECGSSSGNAALGSSVRFAPVMSRSGAVKAAGAVRASAGSSSEEPRAAVRQALVGLLAAGAILVSGVPAFALTGPGGDGAAATAKGADVLLKKADKLTKNDSPARFGEGLKNAGSTASQAGSATASNVQDVADAAVKKARENVSKAKAAFGNVIVSKDKVSDASGALNQAFQVSDASSAINDAKSSASSAVGDAKGFLSGLGDKVTGSVNAGDVASDVQSKAGSAIADAKSNLPSVPSVPSVPSLPEKKAGQKF